MSFIGEFFSFYLDRAHQKVWHKQYEKSCEDSNEKLRLLLPQLNALCQKEYSRLESSPAIEMLCKRIFSNTKTVSKLVVSEEHVVAEYTDGTSIRVFFRELGVRNLSYCVFSNSSLAGRWNLAGNILRKSVSQYKYLDFCEECSRISRTASSYYYSPGFDEKRAVAKIIAQKSHMAFSGPVRREGASGKYVDEIDFAHPPLLDW